MKNSFKWMVLLLAYAVSTAATADVPIKFGQPAHGGSGCPQGSVSATLSSDRTVLAILFDQYVVEAGDQVGKTLDYKSCNIRIPVDIPQGWALSIIQADYRGYHFLPRGARATFSLQYSFGTGNSGRRVNRTAMGPLNDSYLVSDDIIAESYVTSRCGERTVFNVNSSIRTQTNRNGEQALVTLDSADLSSGILYQLQWKRCN